MSVKEAGKKEVAPVPWLVMGKELVANLEDWVSGEKMAKTTELSRTTIWKWANNLGQAGIPLERKLGKGYRLKSHFDILHPAIFLPRLYSGRNEQKPLFVGNHLLYHYLDTVDSTNAVCANMARNGAPDGTLIVAESQTQGRGRRGRSWYSPARASLYLSLLLRPERDMMEAQKLIMMASVALSEVLRGHCKVNALIKWPNDIFINSMKVAGILVEAESKGSRMDWMVLGIGLNVNTESFPPELEHRATSVLRETGERWCRASILIRLILEMETLYHGWLAGDTRELFSKWRKMSYTLGRRVKTEQGFTGYAEEVTPQGGLIIKGDRGDHMVVNAGDVDVIQEP